MKEIIINKNKELVIKEIPNKIIRNQDVFISVDACLIENPIKLGTSRPRYNNLPVRPDYCNIGKVEKINNPISNIRLYDNIATTISRYTGSYYVSSNRVIRIPGDRDTTEACLIGFGGKILRDIKEADVEMGHKIIVVGQGLKGQLTNLIVHFCGADVLGIDTDESRLKLAESSGIKTLNMNDDNLNKKVRDITKGVGADMVFVTGKIESGKLWKYLWEMVRPEGKLIVMHPQNIHLNRHMLLQKNLLIMNKTTHKMWDDYFGNTEIAIPAAYLKHSIQSDMTGFMKIFSEGSISLEHLSMYKINVGLEQKNFSCSLDGADKHLGILCSFY